MKVEYPSWALSSLFFSWNVWNYFQSNSRERNTESEITQTTGSCCSFVTTSPSQSQSFSGFPWVGYGRHATGLRRQRRGCACLRRAERDRRWIRRRSTWRRQRTAQRRRQRRRRWQRLFPPPSAGRSPEGCRRRCLLHRSRRTNRTPLAPAEIAWRWVHFSLWSPSVWETWGKQTVVTISKTDYWWTKKWKIKIIQ